MKLRVNKKRLSLYFEYHWVEMILIILLSFILFYYPMSKINEFLPEEKIVMFSNAGAFIDADLEKEILEKYPGEVLEVEFYGYSPHNEKINDLYEAFGKDADILILREQDLIDMNQYICEEFVGFTQKNNLLEPYVYEGKNYGYKIYDDENQEYNQQFSFEKWIQFIPNTDTYYMVVNAKSINAYPYNEMAKNSRAISIYQELIKKYAKA